jgi:hypothetical protein
MLQPVTFVVTKDGESGVNVTASAPDYVAYEQTFNKSILTGMQDGLWSVYMYVIWHAMSRQSLTPLSWDEWLDTSPMFERELKAEEPVPLEPEAPPGSSPDSQ